MNRVEALYVHVPFCQHICAYCDFCKIIYQKDKVDQYLETLKEDLKDKKGPYKSIYIGGGSPSSLSIDQLDKLFELLKPYMDSKTLITIEVNPEDMNEEKIKLLVRYGISRVSIGIQTFNDGLLKVIGRRHNKAMIETLINDLRKAGINDINGDLMYGLPNQTIADIKNDLDTMTSSLKLNHISTYALLIEPNTYFYVKHIEALDDDVQADQYQFICDYLRKANYNHYEVSNFALKGYESKHNLIYWQAKEYAAVGPGASGYENGIRYKISDSLTSYCKGEIKKENEVLDDNDKEYEYIILSLRLNTGLSFEEFKKRFKKDFLETYKDVVSKLLKNDLVVIEQDHLKVKEDKMFILNQVLQEF